MPLDGTWVQSGWQDQGIARVVVARSQSSTAVLFAEFIVDYYCTGVRDTSYAANVSPDAFQSEGLPRLYAGTPPVAISEELAHEIIWGAVEYAAALGLRPYNRFGETQRVLEPVDNLPRTGRIQFGYQGRPLYRPRPDDNQVAVLRRLIDSVGLGNFYYVPGEEISDEVAALLGIDADGQSEQGDLWTPGSQQTATTATAESGLWVPGEEQSTAPAAQQQPAQSGIWTPGPS